MEESASAACMVAESAVVKTNAKEVEYASKKVLEATLEMNKQSDVNVEKAVVEEEETEGVAKDEKAVVEGLKLEEQDEGMESEEEINEGLGSEEEKTVEEKKAELEEEDGEGLKVEDEKVELE